MTKPTITKYGFYSEIINYLNTEEMQDKIVNGALVKIYTDFDEEKDESYYVLEVIEP